MCGAEEFKSWIVGALRAADLGIIGLEVKEEDLLAAGDKDYDGTLVAEFLERFQTVSLLHRGSSSAREPFHQGNESAGTLAFFGLLGPLARAIKSGGTVCVDELDASLHPLLALEMLRLFNDHKLNPQGAQIIFTTHDTNILDKASLRRDQIWFTEKDAEGGTHLYPLTDFKPRKNENLERGYLQGRYGAVPFIGSTDFFAESRQEEAGP